MPKVCDEYKSCKVKSACTDSESEVLLPETCFKKNFIAQSTSLEEKHEA
jgi:hypothetical protein